MYPPQGVPKPTLADDVSGGQKSTIGAPTATTNTYRYDSQIAEGVTFDVASKTLTFVAGSRAVAVGIGCFNASAPDRLKARLYMGGFQVAESVYIPTYNMNGLCVVLVGSRALSGEQTCKLSVHAYTVGNLILYATKGAVDTPAGIGVGSIKV